MIPPSIEFWSYLVSNVFSILCSVFVLYHLLINPHLRQALSNHVIIILLLLGMVYELIFIPWLLYRNVNHTPWISTAAFYLFSYFFDVGISSTQVALVTWATIERHILIFHDVWVSTHKKRFFVHYLPTAAVLVYCFVYYSLIIFGPFCEKSFNVFIAGGTYVPCVLSRTALGTWHLLVQQFIPTVLIVVASGALLVRVLARKRKVNQPIRWRRHRKLAIQLLSISALYLCFNAPWVVIIFARQYGLSSDLLRIPLDCAAFMRPFVVFLFPFVCCSSVSELRTKLKRSIRCQCWQRRIGAD